MSEFNVPFIFKTTKVKIKRKSERGVEYFRVPWIVILLTREMLRKMTPFLRIYKGYYTAARSY